MYISKILGFIGFIYVISTLSLGYLSFEIVKDALYKIFNFQINIFAETVINISIFAISILILIPGLILLWMSEIGHELRNITYNTYQEVQNIVGANLPSNGTHVEFNPKRGNKGLRVLDVKNTEKAAKNMSSSTRADDRINCPSCNKKVVPRMLSLYGSPLKSVCPYCAATINSFHSKYNKYFYSFLIILITAVSYIFWIILSIAH